MSIVIKTCNDYKVDLPLSVATINFIMEVLENRKVIKYNPIILRNVKLRVKGKIFDVNELTLYSIIINAKFKYKNMFEQGTEKSIECTLIYKPYIRGSNKNVIIVFPSYEIIFKDFESALLFLSKLVEKYSIFTCYIFQILNEIEKNLRKILNTW